MIQDNLIIPEFIGKDSTYKNLKEYILDTREKIKTKFEEIEK